MSFGASYQFYYICLFTCLLVTLGVLNLLRSATGRAFIAIRDSEMSAQSMGIDLTRAKTLSFVVSAAVVGLAGALYAHKLKFISPEQFDLSQSIDLLLLIIVGGVGSIHGAFFGAIFLITLPQFIALAKDWLPSEMAQAAGLQALVYGLVIILFVIFEPLGLYGRWLKLRTFFELFPFYRRGMFRRQKAFQRSERLR
jgi:branched-chain amino acid transport system permease protein